ncbi:MAG: phage tail protein [Alphaproteobacteria bacterium]|nr:phage tail protein [Alphaproteobacteria bacterium]
MSNKHLPIAGAKGGGGKGGGGGTARAPVEAPDSLRSRSFGRVVDLICEGEIEGPINGWDDPLLSTYLNETLVRNADGTFNFSGVTMEMRPGTQSQSYIQGFSGVENELPVTVEVTNATPLIKTITNANVNAVRVTIGIPQLSEQNPTSGDVNGSTVDLAIDVQTNGGGYVERLTKTITGKTMSRYQESYVISLSGTGPWDIRLRRTTPDNGSAVLVNKTYWDSYTEITYAKLRYPNSVLSAMQVDSKQFNSIPNRAWHLKLMRIRVPSNYDPVTRAYTGSWDGTFKTAWSNNPAWCFYDLLTTSRYGLGDYVPAELADKWVLYTIGQYCDVLVADGFGGFEPRFTCNLYLQTREEAFKVMQDMASIFRGMIYWANGSVTAVQDAPVDPAYIFSNSNVIDGKFTYSGSSQKQRHTVALVRWNDPADFYRQKIEYVEDRDGIERYGIVETEIVAVGCASRGQAHRAGKWLLNSELSETETVSFATGIEGAVARPGQVIKVQDADRAAARRSGRISAATLSTITIDGDATLDPGTNTLYAMMPDGTVATRTITSLVGRVITVSTNFPAVPNEQAIWMISSATVAVQTFRVISVSEQDGIYAVSALKHNPDKYDAIESDIVLEEPSVSFFLQTPSTPASISVSEILYAAAQDFKTMITLSWPHVDGATSYEVSYSVDNGNSVPLPAVSTHTIDLRDMQPGLYKFQVVAVSPLGKRSWPAETTEQIYGKTAPPSDVTNFFIQGTILTWAPVSDIDVAGYSIRFQPGTSRSWGDAVPIHAGLITDSPYDMGVVPSGQNTIMIKAVDTSGNESLNVAFIVVNLGDPDVANIVETFDRQLVGWPGTLTGGTVNGSNQLEAASETLMWDGNEDAAMWAEDASKLMWSTNIYTQMTYEDQIIITAGLAGSKMTINRDVVGDPWSIYYRHDGPGLMWNADASVLMWGSGSDLMWDVPPYQPWPGEVTVDNQVAYDFLITTGHGTTQGKVNQFAIVIDAPDIEETFDDIAVLAAGTRLPITKPFTVIKNIQLTVQNDGGAAVTARYEDKDVDLGPLITALSAAGAAVDGILDARVKGY